MVGDVREEILEALRTLSARADVVLVSGGLGPTADDLTAEVAAQAAGVRLVEHAGAAAQLRERFAERNLTVTENNLKQVQVPEGAEVVLNPVGSAPMFILRLGRAVLFFVPGVPREYRALVEQVVLPRIRALRAERGRNDLPRAPPAEDRRASPSRTSTRGCGRSSPPTPRSSSASGPTSPRTTSS